MEPTTDIKKILEKIASLSFGTEQRILQLIEGLQAQVKRLESELLTSLLTDFVAGISTTAGKVDRTPENFNKVAKLDAFFAKFKKLFVDNQVADFGTTLLGFAAETGVYFEAIGFSKDIVDRIAQKNTLLEARIGIKDGKLTKGAYLDNLGQTATVKNQLKNIVLSSINNGSSASQLALSLRDYIKGTKDVDGALVKYYDQYAYDSFNQVRELKNQQYAEDLQLGWFIYAGSIIGNTRRFCSKRAGKMFHISETKTWKDDADLIDPKTKALYNPIIDRGRYRCRHHIQYISERMAERFDKEKFDLITKKNNEK